MTMMTRNRAIHTISRTPYSSWEVCYVSSKVRHCVIRWQKCRWLKQLQFDALSVGWFQTLARSSGILIGLKSRRAEQQITLLADNNGQATLRMWNTAHDADPNIPSCDLKDSTDA
jgi:hypothetical protein